jgi:hypothetical protein
MTELKRPPTLKQYIEDNNATVDYRAIKKLLKKDWEEIYNKWSRTDHGQENLVPSHETTAPWNNFLDAIENTGGWVFVEQIETNLFEEILFHIPLPKDVFTHESLYEHASVECKPA